MTVDLARALKAAGVRVQEQVELPSPAAARDGERPRSVTEYQVPDPGPESGQMLLVTDEYGLVSWCFAPAPDAGTRRGRGAGGPPGGTRTYALPPSRPRPRGPLTATGKKVLEVLVFPILEPGIGRISDTFALHWERKHRPYRVRTFTPDDYALPAGREITAGEWPRLAGGRALLFVHGTFSRTDAAFGALPRDFVAALDERYEGRVFAFDHFTLSHDPRQNVEWLIAHIPDGTALDLDIVCHSRGGLVSRVLAERQAELAMGTRSLHVRRIVFVGTPNAGTALADADHMGDFIDAYTNLLTFLPDTGVLEVLTAVVTVAKQLAVGAVNGLSGLQSMRPGGGFAQWLNAGPRRGNARYFALASDFTPDDSGLPEAALDGLMDRIFRAANDLVVPTEGVFEPNGSGFFPIEDPIVFRGRESMAHTRYFASAAARGKIIEWLEA